MRTRTRYLPLVEAAAGMTLAAPVAVRLNGVIRYSLPGGHVLTADNLYQLGVHRAEFLFIAEPDTRGDEQIASDAAAAAHRTLEIFAGADLSEPTLATLFDRVLAYRSA